MMDIVTKEDVVVVMNFLSVMADPLGLASYSLSEDAVMDWFGRSLLGQERIICFFKMQSCRMNHTIEKIQRIPAIKHRLLKRFDNVVAPLNEEKSSVTERGQGDSQHTPENKVRPNLEELCKAPRRKLYKSVSNLKQWSFLEIMGKLEIKTTVNDVEHIEKRKFHRVVLGFSDQIHLIVYEVKSTPRKLF